VRESLIGFSPDTDMAAVPFTNTTYYLDPSFPLLLDLLSKEEATRYAKLSPRSRPGAVSAEINIILQILGARIQYVDAFLGKVQVRRRGREGGRVGKKNGVSTDFL